MPTPAPTLCVPWGRHRRLQAPTVSPHPQNTSSSGLGRGPGCAAPWRGGSPWRRKPPKDGEVVLSRLEAVGRSEAVGKAMTGLLCALALP